MAQIQGTPQETLWSDGHRLLTLPIERIRPPQTRLRTGFSEESIAALAESIQLYGLLSPISVRAAQGGYELIAGERRLRAMVRLGLHFVDAFVINACDMDAALMALVENIQREQLHYLEEAEAFRAMVRDHQLSQQQLAERIGRSQSMVANRIRLLQLPFSVRTQLRENGLSERHARALLKISGEQQQLQAVQAATERQLSVRQLEEWIARPGRKPERKIKMYLRDHRMFVNTVLDAVKALKRAGVNASGRVVDEQDRIEVIVTLPKIRDMPRNA